LLAPSAKGPGRPPFRTLREDLAVVRPETAGDSAGQLRPAAVAPTVSVDDVIGEAVPVPPSGESWELDACYCAVGKCPASAGAG